MPPYNMDCSSHSDSYYNNNNNNQQSSSSTPTSPAKQPLHKLNKSTSNCETQNELLQLAALELESFRRPTSSTNSSSSSISSPQRKVRKQNSSNSLNSTNSNSSNESVDQIEETERAFPQACLHLLHTLSGNTKCHDCLAPSPSWASVSYGITLCLQCSGKHRSLGVNVSYVKSLTLDSWKRTEILCMLEGGNGQLDTFFSRHEMGSPQIAATTRKTLDSPSSNSSSPPRGSPTTKNTVGVLDRYKTKAASFYRQHLKSHAKTIASKDGLYEGRDAHRNKKKSSSSSKSSKRRGDKSSSSGGGGGSKGKTKLLGEKMKKGNEVVQQILESVTEVDIDSSCGSTRSAGFM